MQNPSVEMAANSNQSAHMTLEDHEPLHGKNMMIIIIIMIILISIVQVVIIIILISIREPLNNIPPKNRATHVAKCNIQVLIWPQI